MSNNRPRIATINDINSSSNTNLTKINSKDLVNSLRETHGLEPEKEEEMYDGYTDKIIKTVGKQVSDEMFEQAKEIIYSRALELQLEGSPNNSNDNIEEDLIVQSSDIKINKVPGPKRKK